RSASIMIQKQTGANTVDIVDAVKELLPQYQKNLPPDIHIETVMDTSENVKVSIGSLLETILLALIIVGVIVLFFLGRWRATIIIMISIPISLIGSFIYLYLTGNTINIISLSALSICIGMVVDDAIVVLENITTHVERGSHPKQAAIYGTEEVSLSVIASTLTIVAAFLPMTMVEGMAGIMFKQLGWMVTIIIVLSMIIALTLTPMMSSKMLRSNKELKTTKFDKWYNKRILPMLDKLDIVYARLLNFVVRKRGKTIGVILVIFIVGAAVSALTLKTEFMPSSDNNTISMTVELPAGTRMELAKQTGMQINQLIKEKYPEVEINSFTVGSADDDNIFASIQDNGPNIMSFNVRTVEAKYRNRSIDDLSDDLRKDLAAIPAISKFVVTPGGNSSGMGASTMDVEIYGYDFAETDKLAAEMKTKLENIEGLRDITLSRKDYRMEYQIEFDREKLSLNGLSMATAASAVRNRINGLTTTSYREEGEEYDICVRYTEESRQSIEDVENILIYNPMGVGVRVRDLGRVVENSSLPAIERKDRERVVTVSGSLYNRALSDVAADVNSAISTMDIPMGMQIEIGGSLEDQQEAFSDLIMLLVIVVLLVYIVWPRNLNRSPIRSLLFFPFLSHLSVRCSCWQ
ncbi:MAG: efflux RND transporter permease subunit, partial [Proteiniphilum sp.]|nr:efflux RND transporter permease subunit [Proteiniphilum sp.]